MSGPETSTVDTDGFPGGIHGHAVPLRGEHERPVPASSARRSAERTGGPGQTRARPGTARPAEPDRPDEVACGVFDRMN